jgi:hypothetical protein
VEFLVPMLKEAIASNVDEQIDLSCVDCVAVGTIPGFDPAMSKDLALPSVKFIKLCCNDGGRSEKGISENLMIISKRC